MNVWWQSRLRPSQVYGSTSWSVGWQVLGRETRHLVRRDVLGEDLIAAEHVAEPATSGEGGDVVLNVVDEHRALDVHPEPARGNHRELGFVVDAFDAGDDDEVEQIVEPVHRQQELEVSRIDRH